MKTRVDIINHLISTRGYRRYLEIGCQNDWSFSRVAVAEKVGVDPVSGGTVRMKSDAYFSALWLVTEKPSFDVVFIDGDHHHAQVLRDVENALEFLAPGGAIVMHDCLPATPEEEKPNFCGTAWRAFVKMREHLGLDAITADMDHGVGIIRRGRNPDPIRVGRALERLTFATLQRNRERWMRPRDDVGVRAFCSEGWES